MRRYFFSLFFLLAITGFKAFGQTFVHIDLTGSPNSSQTYTGSRNTSSYCGDSNCIVFVVTLNPGADLLNITSGQLAASDNYTVNCGPQTPVGTPVCITGGSNSDTIAFCKPGNNSITYTITSSTAVKASGGTTLRQLCSGTLSVAGLTSASATWTSISPGAAGAYNSYLSCLQCTTTTVMPAVGAPASILYQVSGLTNCANSRSDTVRIYTVPPLTVSITPAAPAICNGAPVTLTANITGGNPPYTYSWSSGQTTPSISTSTPGTYTVSVSDNTTGCPAVSQSVTVTTNPTPTVTSAASATVCNTTAQNYTITSSVSGTTYSWGRAAVAGISNAAVSGQSANPITESLTNTTNAPVNVVYAITPTANGCPGPVFNYTVTVNPTPAVTSAASATICNTTAQNYTITGSVAGTSYSWGRAAVAGISNGAVAGQTSSTITESLTNTTNAPVNVTYIITPTANGCPGPAFTYTLTVNPTPTVTSAASAAICNATAQNYAITSNVAGTTFSWGRAAVTGISNAAVSNQTSSTITESLTNTTSAPINVIYVITPTANGCSGPAFTYTLTVNPTPQVTSAASASICNSTAQNYTITSNVTGTTFSWGRAAVAGISNGAVSNQTGNPITESLTNTTNAPVAVAYVITPTANGCSGPAFTYTLTVNPTPTVTSAASATTCNNSPQNYAITASVTGTTFSWGRAAVAGISNAAVSGQTSSTITETLVNTTNAPVVVTYIIAPTANGCSGPAFTYTLTVNPTPTVTSAASAAICNTTAQNYAITSNVTGTTFSWGRAAVTGISNGAVSNQTSSTITESLTNTTSAPVAVTYLITPTANGCSGPVFTYTLTVNPTPTVTSAVSATICNSTAQNYTITSNVTGTTFSWGRAAVAGISNGAVSNQTSSTITETLVNTTNAPVAVAYVITPTANGCSGPAFTYTLTVNPTPTVTSAASATTCNNSPQNYAITASVTGTTFSWGRAAVAGISNAAVSGQTSSTITETLVNTTNAPVVVTYLITPTANGCSGPVFTYTLTVNPTPTVTSAASAAICNSTAQNYAITSNVTGTTFSWGRAAVTGISNGAVSNQTSSTITESLTNTTSAPVNVVYIITPSANGCPGPAFTYTLTVNPTPTVTSAASATICNSTAQNYTITSNVTGTTFSWGRAAVTGISNAAVAGQTSSTITESLTNTTSAPVNVVYIITPTANGCSGPAFTYTVTVNPTPTVTSAATATICNNSPQNYIITSNVTGTTFNWGRATVAGISNGAAVNQTSSSITETLVNTTNAPVNVTYIITPSANGCPGPAFTYTLTVNPTPTVTSAASATVCNKNAQNYIITGSISGTTFLWSRPAVAGVSNAAVSNQSSNPITEVLDNTTNSPVTVTYFITPIANGCPGPVFNYSVTINPTADPAFFYSSGTFCKTGTNPTPTIVNPSGGTFSSSAGLVFIDNHTGEIDLSASALGTYTITFVTNTTCSYSSSANVTVTNSPDATFSYPGPYCQKQTNPLPIFPAGSSAGVFSSSNPGLVFQNTSTGEIDLQQSLAGTYTVTNNIVASGGCAATSSTNTVTINPIPTVNAGPDQTVCSGQVVTLQGTIGGGASSATWSGGSGTFSNASSLNTIYTPAPGETSVTLTLTTDDPTGPCGAAVAQLTITIHPTPSVTSAANGTICSGDPQNYTITSDVAGTTFTWSRPAVAGVSNAAASGQTSNPITETLVNTTSAPVNVVYTIVPFVNGCTGAPFNYTVTVNPTPTVTSAATDSICNNTPQNYTITSAVAGTTFTWGRAAVAGIGNAAVSGQTSSTITESLTNTTTAPIAVTYIITPQGNGCPGPVFNYVVTVNPTPTVTSAATAAICNSTAQNYAITSNVAGATFTWSRPAVAGISNAAVSGQTSSTITESLTNTTSAPVDVAYIITPATNGCSGPSFNYTITVNPTPVVTSAATATICNTTAQNYTITSNVNGTTYSWSRAAVAGIGNAPVSAQTSNPITESLTNTTSAPVAVTYVIIPQDGACFGPAFNYTVTVNPTPTVTSAATDTICNNTPQNYAITSNVAGTGFTWSRPAVAGISNAAVNGQTSSTITETLVNTTTAPIAVTYVITPKGNSCSGPVFNYVVTVNPTPTVTSASSATLCNNIAQNYTITGSVTGTTYNWSRAAVPGVSNGAVTAQTSGTITETLVNTTSAPITVTYVIIPSAYNCQGPAFNYLVTVNPTPTVTSAISDTVCNGTAQNYTITSNVSGTTFTWGRVAVAGINNAAVSGQTGNLINETLVNSTSAPVNVVYTIVPAANGCTGPAFNYTVTVNPTPTVTSAATGTVCNSTAQNYTISSNVNGAAFSWNRPLVGGISNASVSNQSSSTITETLINTTNAPVTVTYIITPLIQGCSGPAFNYVVTVNPTPTVTSAASAIICNSTAQNYVITGNVNGTTYNWSRPVVAGISNPAVSNQADSAITESLTNTTSAPVNVTYVITPTANGCSGPTFNYVVTVNPTPTVTSAASDTICNNTAQNYTITSAVMGATFSWGRATVTGISNAAVSGQTASTITETLVNTTNAPVTVTYIITPTANGCSGPAFNYVVTVNPTPTVTSAANAAICDSTAQNYAITSNVSGATFSWGRGAVTGISNPAVAGQTGGIITETLVNTTNAPVAVPYIITPLANGCPGPAFTYTVTVNPIPKVTSAASATTCNNSPQNYIITSNVTGATFSWGRAAVAGISNGAVSNQTSNAITETLVNTTNAPVAVTYLITPTANGCSGPVFTYIVTVNPTPTVTSAASATICNSTAQNYTITSNVSGATFSWGRAAVTGISNAAVSNQTTGTITESLTNTTSAPVNVTYVITPITNGCSGPAFTYTVTVNPTPTVTSAASAVICNSTAQNYIITSNVTGTTFSWGRAAVAGISNGAVSNLAGNKITDTLVNTTNAPIAVTYIITPTANGCSGPAFNYTLTVNPTPIVTSAATDTICNNTAQNYTISGSVNGTTFSWGRPVVTGISNPAVSNQTSSNIAETLVNTTTAPIAVTYIITPTANGCSGPAFNYVLTVNPTPTVTSPANATICNNTAQNYAITGNVSGTTFTWSRPAVAGIGNAAVNGQTSSAITETLVNTTNAPVAATYLITPAGNGCSGPVFSYKVTINPTATITNASLTQTVCSEGNSVPVTLTSNVNGAGIAWTAAATAGITGFTTSGTNVIPAQTLLNAGITTGTVTYTITPSYNGCDGVIATYTIQVPPKPATPLLSSNSPVCTGTTLSLSTAAVAGATYNWTGPNGFSSTVQNPQINNVSLAFQGNYKLTVTVNGCTSNAGTTAVVINQTPVAPIAASNSPICAGSALNLAANTVAGGAYSWTGPGGFTSSVQNPVIPNAQTTASGTYSVTVTVNGCPSPAGTVAAVVNPIPPAPVLSSNSPVCEKATLNLKASNVPGASYSWTGPNGFISNQQNPSIPGTRVIDSGTYIATVTVNGCSAQSSIRVSINQEIINPIATSNSPVCSTYPIQLKSTTYVGASYKWTGPNGFTSNQQNPVVNNAGLSNSGRYSVTVTSAACAVVGSSFTDVVVNQTPLAPTVTSNSPICAGQPLQLFASNVNGGTYSWTGPNGFTSNLQNPVIANAALVSAGQYSVTVTVNSCTSAVASTNVVIDKPAIVSAGSNQTVCANNATVSLNGTVTGSSTTGVWSSSGTGTFTAGKSSLIGTYIPSVADAAKGIVKLTLTATNTGACLDTASITVTITPIPVVSAGKNIQVCSNEVITLNGTVDHAGGGRWTSSGTGTFTPSNTDLNAVYTPSVKDQADRKVIFTLTSTGNGMCLPVSSTMTAAILPAPVIDSMVLQYVLQKNTIVLKPTVTGTNLQYLWTPNLYLNNNTLKNPVFTGVGDIIYTLTVTDAAGCTTSAQLQIKVLKPIIIPNTFTPNGDGINDTWVIQELHNYPGATVRIFDRYGMQLLYSEGYGKPWDGTYNGKPVPFGVYYYVINLKQYGKPLSGYITVIR